MLLRSFSPPHSWSRLTTFTTLVGWTCINHPYMNKQLYFTYSVTFLWLKQIPIHQLKIYVLTFLSTSTFMIKAYNKHSIHLWCEHVWTPLYEQTTLFNLFCYLFWLKPIPLLQLTQSLCYNVPFHLYIHDQGSQQTFTTLVGSTCMFGYLFWLKRIPIHQLTQSLCDNLPFHLYIHD